MPIADLEMRRRPTRMKRPVLMVTAFLILFAPSRAAAQLRLLVGGAMAEPVKKVGANFKNNLTTDTSGVRLFLKLAPTFFTGSAIAPPTRSLSCAAARPGANKIRNAVSIRTGLFIRVGLLLISRSAIGIQH